MTLAVAKSRISQRRRLNSVTSTCRLPANSNSASTPLRNTRGSCAESSVPRNHDITCRWNT